MKTRTTHCAIVFLTILSLLLTTSQISYANVNSDPELISYKNSGQLLTESCASCGQSTCQQNPCPATDYFTNQTATPPSFIVVASPQFHYTKHSSADNLKMDSARLKADKGSTRTTTMMLVGAKPLTENFTLSAMYEYGHGDYNGGTMVLDDPSISSGHSHDVVNSHVVGLLFDYNARQYGKFQFSLLQGFDNYHGYETWIHNLPQGQLVDRRSTDDQLIRVTSLMLWYENDIALHNSWKITPYAGWRTLYAHVKDQNNFAVAANSLSAQKDDNMWIHLASAGLKLAYQKDAFGFGLRGGINHRTTSNDVPGFASRAVAPGVVHYSYPANIDRTIGTFGVDVNYTFTSGANVKVGYDGYVESSGSILYVAKISYQSDNWFGNC